MGYVSRACEYKRGWGDGRGYGKKEAKRQFVIRSFESRYGKLDEVSRKRINRFDEEQLDKLITILLPSPPSNGGDPDPEGQRLVDEVIEGEICRVRSEGLPISVSGSVPCPVCKEGALRRIKGREGFFWGCGCYPACKVSFPDKKGKPDTDSRRPIAMVSEEHICSKCEKGLIWRESARKQGVYWWGCSGFPACNFRAFDENGKPKVEI